MHGLTSTHPWKLHCPRLRSQKSDGKLHDRMECFLGLNSRGGCVVEAEEAVEQSLLECPLRCEHAAEQKHEHEVREHLERRRRGLRLCRDARRRALRKPAYRGAKKRPRLFHRH